MFSKILSATAVALAATNLVSAQTFTSCDPRTKSCPPDPAIGKENTVVVDFTQGANNFFKVADGTTLKYSSKGAAFSMGKETEAPTITSTKYLFFGKVDVQVIAAPGTGIVTSVVLQSDDRDEIDWEWIGSDTKQVQTNYFGKGDDSTFDRGGFSPVDNPQSTVHTYTFDWTKDYVRWIIDGNIVRELKYADAKGGTRFPQTPCQLKLGAWVAGSSTAPEGTVQWAGGLADFSKGPFTAYYQKVTITDYANGVANAKNYVWADGSDGSYQSIKVDTDGKGDDSSSSSSSTSDSSTSEPPKSTSSSSATKTGSSSMTTVTTSASSGSSNSPSQTGSGNASQTGGSSGTNTSASTSSTPRPTTNAAFKPSFGGVLAGAGLLAAVAL